VTPQRQGLPRSIGGADINCDARDCVDRKALQRVVDGEGYNVAMTLFEKIIARQIPAKIEYEDDNYIVIHDISPQAPVHVLVVPKKPIATLNDITPGDTELVGGMFIVASKVMCALGHSDYRATFNCGPGAQQTVFHLHLHCLAGRAFTWPPG